MNVITIDTNALKKADWMATRDQLLRQAEAVTTVRCQDDLERAGALQSALSKHEKALHRHRLGLTRLLDDAKKQLICKERELCSDIVVEKERLRLANSAYATALAEEAKRKAAVLEARRRMAIEAQVARQQENESKAKRFFGRDATVHAPVIPPPPATVVTNTVTSNANRMVKRIRFDVVDESRVPREYLTVDPKKIRAAVNYRKKLGMALEIPGVRIWEDVDVQSK